MEEKRFRFEKGCAITDPSFAVDTKWFCQTWGHEYKYEEGIIEDVMMNVNIPNGGMFITRNLEPNKTKFIKCDDTLAIFNLGSEHFTDQYIKERLHEDNYILFEGSGWGFIKNVDDLYVSIQLEFDDGYFVYSHSFSFKKVVVTNRVFIMRAVFYRVFTLFDESERV